jgi:unsaturated rhamnogalacturonyl hydrolase
VVNRFLQTRPRSSVTHNPALSYHNDNGIGLDSYDVGPSRGCGGTAVWADGKLTVSKNYTVAKILAAGPIRFEFEVSYAPWLAGGRMVTETKRITLDAGSHLNKIVSTFTFDGGSPLDWAAGIVIHDGDIATLPAGKGIASVWDTPQKPSAGRIATGLLSLPAQHAATMTATNHALMIFERHSGESFEYFVGSGWSKADRPTQEDWNAYLIRFEELQKHPVAGTWVKR